MLWQFKRFLDTVLGGMTEREWSDMRWCFAGEIRVGKPVNELVQELRYYARHSKDGKISEECVVPKALLADVADKLEEILNRCPV